MDFQALKSESINSPAFIIDEVKVVKSLQALASLREQTGSKVLYSIKSLSLTAILELSKPYIDGFSVSSLFEARLAGEVLAGQGSIHLTTPGVKSNEMPELAQYCTHISCNSISQFQRFAPIVPCDASIGIRVNPQLSFTEDARYDPCRKFSKLGVDLKNLQDSNFKYKIKGLHFHTVFSAENYSPLAETLARLTHQLDEHRASLEWINFGGGYLYDQINDHQTLGELIKQLKNQYGLQTYLEPGNAVVGKAGYLLATVIDCLG